MEMQSIVPVFGGWTRPGGAPGGTAACGNDGLAFVIHPAIALGEGETTGWNGWNNLSHKINYYLV